MSMGTAEQPPEGGLEQDVLLGYWSWLQKPITAMGTVESPWEEALMRAFFMTADQAAICLLST